MKKEYRVKKSTEIEKILSERKCKSNQYFSVFVKNNSETSHFRYAISVGKKIGNAVKRNHFKRLITASISNLDIKLDNNIDVFIIAKSSIINLEYNDIYKELKYLFSKHKLIKQGETNE
ncbi:MAG: ribonuclease P protein component [Acholeplasmatales bacterium]|nr:ribonuclease P protein component [Acholeplasmatales bacterium]